MTYDAGFCAEVRGVTCRTCPMWDLNEEFWQQGAEAHGTEPDYAGISLRALLKDIRSGRLSVVRAVDELDSFSFDIIADSDDTDSPAAQPDSVTYYGLNPDNGSRPEASRKPWVLHAGAEKIIACFNRQTPDDEAVGAWSGIRIPTDIAAGLDVLRALFDTSESSEIAQDIVDRLRDAWQEIQASDQVRGDSDSRAVDGASLFLRMSDQHILDLSIRALTVLGDDSAVA